MDRSVPGADRVADWLVQVAPADPQTHLTAALIYEKTFDTNDLERSLNEYEAAAALSPYDYMRWLDLGKARGLNGDTDGARAAYARAVELAPNYALVQWAYGNSLIRAGDSSDGFALLAMAAAGNAEYAKPAATTGLQIFDGDITKLRQELGDTATTNAALAALLTSQKRFDEAYEAWSRIAVDARIEKYKQLGSSLIDQMTTSKRFAPAAMIAADLQPNLIEKPFIGQVLNGDFENGVKLRRAPLFEWQIAEGSQPQVGLAEGQSHSGRYSLFVLFNTFASADFRDISQTVAVEPAAEYEFEIFYRSDLKTPASLRWAIVDAVTGEPIAGTPYIVPAAEWTPIRARFTVPRGSDGVIIRLEREGCAGPSCPMNGKLSFDDISLKRL
jgi:hypothetical protein